MKLVLQNLLYLMLLVIMIALHQIYPDLMHILLDYLAIMALIDVYLLALEM